MSIRPLERATTEVWFRSPARYVSELKEVGPARVVFDETWARTPKNWYAWMKLHFGVSVFWEMIILSDRVARLYNSEDLNIKAVWPIWDAEVCDWKKLERMCQNGALEVLPGGAVTDASRMPVAYQKDVIVVNNLPDLRNPRSDQLILDLSEFQDDHPEVTLFLTGINSYRVLFGMNFRMGDLDCTPRGSSVRLPTGPSVECAQLSRKRYWTTLMGTKVIDLMESYSERAKFNIKSAVWAGSYYKRALYLSNARYRRDKYPEFSEDFLEEYVRTMSTPFTGPVKAQPGDRILCDSCSIWLSCRLFREGAVCAVPNSDMKDIGELFGTRDSQSIVSALGKLLQVNSTRAEVAISDEAGSPEGINPEVTKLLDNIFKNGVTLLQLVDASYRTGSRTTVSVLSQSGQGRVEVSQTDAQRSIVQNAYAALEAQGHARETITEDMVLDWIRITYPAEVAAIEGSASS